MEQRNRKQSGWIVIPETIELLNMSSSVYVKPLGFVPDLSMRCVGDNLIGGYDVHGPTIIFSRMHLSNRYTTSYGCRDLVERVTRQLRHPFLQAIEELARTNIE
jgi:hypothetical protein